MKTVMCVCFHILFFYILICLLIPTSHGFVCASQNKIGQITETCPTIFGNRDRKYCCEQLDGTLFCCDQDEYIRNRGKRRKYFHDEDFGQRKTMYEDESIDYSWWLFDWIMYIVPIVQIGVCIICCVCRCSPCCKQRRRGIVYRIQQPTAVVNIQPFGPAPGVLPSQTSLPIVTPTSGHLPMPQPGTATFSLLQAPPYPSHTLSQEHITALEEPPPPYTEVVSETYSKHVVAVNNLEHEN